MSSTAQRVFGRFRLDLVNALLWLDDQPIRLRRKTFEVLRYLVERPGQLVTKQELLDEIWTGVSVSDSMPAISVAELRRALSDNSRQAIFIQTVHGRGYRFTAEVSLPTTSICPAMPSPLFVGRKDALMLLHDRFAQAAEGKRQAIFVTGEAGIGKSALIDVFLDMIDAGSVRIARGQCIEQYGSGEPYMPVLEALTRLGGGVEGKHLIATLRRLAPSWLAQMPALLDQSDDVRTQAAAESVTQHRLLRELALALEEITAEKPVLLFLEDLHWSDASTLALVSSLARRNELARLLIIGTYRPVDMLVQGHPLGPMKQELELHRCCEELRLPMLSEADVAAYLAARFPEHARARSFEQLPALVYQRTDGNPLFMVNVADYLAEQDSLLTPGTIAPPHNVRQMIEQNIERLTAVEQQVLETASVCGVQFSAAAIAAALQGTIGEIEACCSLLARREQFLTTEGVSDWPNGTASTRFGFRHALYCEVLYDRITAARGVELHRRIAECQETAYGEQTHRIAGELAYHFAAANDKAKALKYEQQSARNALERSANAEAISHYQAALQIVETFLPSSERFRQELRLCIFLQTPLIALTGYTSPEVERLGARAHELSSLVSAGPELFPVLGSLASFHLNRGELHVTMQLGQRMLRIAEKADSHFFGLWAKYILGFASIELGNYDLARLHLESAIALYDRDRSGAYGYVQDPGPTALVQLSTTLLCLGFPDLAFTRDVEGLALARALSHPYTLAWTLGRSALNYAGRGDYATALKLNKEQIALCSHHGFDELLTTGRMGLGTVLVEMGRIENGIEQLHDVLPSAKHHRPFGLVSLANAYRQIGRYDEGLILVAEGLDRESKCDRLNNLAELYQLKGELLQAKEAQVDAERCFRHSIQIAQSQNDRWQELTSAMFLAKLLQSRGHTTEAHVLLSSIYNWYTEGFDTQKLKSAKSLIKQLSSIIDD